MPNDTDKTSDLSSRAGELSRLMQGLSDSRVLAGWVLLDILITFCRPQETLHILGTLRLPLIVSTIPALMWFGHIKKTWTPQTKAMIAFLTFHAVYIFVGKTIYDPLIRNDFWAAQTWRDLLQMFTGMIFPMVAVMASTRQLERVVNVFFFCGVYLAFYALTHGGHGPSGFLGDENDLCFALVMFSAFAFILLETKHSFGGKLKLFVVIGALLGGIVASESRGGFVGLMCVLAYVFKRSRNKALLLLLGLLMVIGAAALAPKEYWNEVRSIKEVHQGTAQSRLDIWAVAIKVWLDPRHFVQGVGLENVRHWLGDYEPSFNKTNQGKSIAGRAVHSMYMQLLAEQGVIGICFFFILVGGSFRQNLRQAKKINLYIDRLKSVQRISEKQLAVELSDRMSTDPTVRAVQMIPKLRRELDLLFSFTSAINVAFVAVMAAGAFISVLYYPPLWLLIGMSAALFRYFSSFERSLVPFAEDVAKAIALRSSNVTILR